MPPNPEIKDSNLESTNPGFRDSSLTSPMTSLLANDYFIEAKNYLRVELVYFISILYKVH